jgi:predicted hydrocarbon binding protein
MVTKDIVKNGSDPRLNHLGKNISESIGKEIVKYFDTGKFHLNNLMSYSTNFNYTQGEVYEKNVDIRR